MLRPRQVACLKFRFFAHVEQMEIRVAAESLLNRGDVGFAHPGAGLLDECEEAR